MHSFGAKCTWTQMFCWKTRSYLSHRSLGLHCHGGGIIWHGINWEQQMRSMMKVFVLISNYVEFKTLEGRRRCCSVCQPGEVSHCSPRRTDWTSMVSDAILVKLYELFEHADFSGLLTSWGMLLLRFVLNTICLTLFFMRKWTKEYLKCV